MSSIVDDSTSDLWDFDREVGVEIAFLSCLKAEIYVLPVFRLPS